MTPSDDLLREFERLTTPETPATPTFQQSGTHNIQLQINGDGNRIGIPGAADRIADRFVRWLRVTAPIAAILMAVAVAYLAISADSADSIGHYLGIMASALAAAAAIGTICVACLFRSSQN